MRSVAVDRYCLAKRKYQGAVGQGNEENGVFRENSYYFLCSFFSFDIPTFHALSCSHAQMMMKTKTQNRTVLHYLAICTSSILHRWFSSAGVPCLPEDAAVFYDVKELRLKSVVFKLLLAVGVEKRGFIQLRIISCAYIWQVSFSSFFFFLKKKSEKSPYHMCIWYV